MRTKCSFLSCRQDGSRCRARRGLEASRYSQQRIAEILSGKQNRQSRPGPGPEVALKFSAAQAQAPAKAPSQPSVIRSPSAPVMPHRRTDWSAMLSSRRTTQAPEPRVKCTWEQTMSAFNLAAKSITGPVKNTSLPAQPSPSGAAAANLRGSSTMSQLMDVARLAWRVTHSLESTRVQPKPAEKFETYDGRSSWCQVMLVRCVTRALPI